MAHALDESICVSCSPEAGTHRLSVTAHACLMLLRVGGATQHPRRRSSCGKVIRSGIQKTCLEGKWLPWTFLATQDDFLSHVLLMELGGMLVN